MYKNATKCNETLGKWCKTKHGASKIIDTFETYQLALKCTGIAPYRVRLLYWAANLNHASFMLEIYSITIVDIQWDVEVFIVCLSCHFDMGKLPYPRAGGTSLAFSMIHVCLQWQELAWDLSRLACGLGTRIHGTWDFQLMVCQEYNSYLISHYP
jgi:hypothetical protein